MRTIINKEIRTTMPQVVESMNCSIGHDYDLVKADRICYSKIDRDIGSRSENINDCTKHTYVRRNYGTVQTKKQ